MAPLKAISPFVVPPACHTSARAAPEVFTSSRKPDVHKLHAHEFWRAPGAVQSVRDDRHDTRIAHCPVSTCSSLLSVHALLSSARKREPRCILYACSAECGSGCCFVLLTLDFETQQACVQERLFQVQLSSGLQQTHSVPFIRCPCMEWSDRQQSYHTPMVPS